MIHRILDGMLRLMMPVLSFTAAEAWEHLYGLNDTSPLEESIFFAEFPQVDDLHAAPDFDERWERLLAARGEITKVLEAARREKKIGLSLDAEVLILAEGNTADFLAANVELLKEICIVSELRLVAEAGDAADVAFVDAETVTGLKIAVKQAMVDKCERCWTLSPTVGDNKEHPAICARCASVVAQLDLG